MQEPLEQQTAAPGATGLHTTLLRSVRIILIGLLAVPLLLLGISFTLLGPDALSREATAVLVGFTLVTLIALLRLHARRFREAVGLVVIGVLTGLAIETAISGIEGFGPFFLAYAIPMAFAALLLGRWALIATAAASIAVVVTVHVAQVNGAPWAGIDTQMPMVGTVVIAFVLVTAFLALVLDQFGVELRSAHEAGLRREEELAQMVGELALQIEERKRAELEREAAEAETRRLNRELEVRVAKRTAELQEALGEIEAFAYSVAHDLRAPLRGIDGFSQALLEDYGERLDDAGLQYIARIRGGASRMGRLIDSLLALAGLSRARIEPVEVDLSEMARDLLDELRQSAPEREAEFAVEPGMVVRADHELIQTFLAGLLDNAWKFSRGRQPARIEVGSQVIDDERTFFVRDNGVGFDMEYYGKLFQPFQKLHGDEYEGTGIGLALAQRIVARHGGALWARSGEEGTTFYFRLGT